MKTNEQVTETWLQGNGATASAGHLRCEGDILYSYDLQIGFWKDATAERPRHPVLWRYLDSSVKAEKANVSITTTQHLNLVYRAALRRKVDLDWSTPSQEQLSQARNLRKAGAASRRGW